MECIVHKDHVENYSTSGLAGSIRKYGLSVRGGGDPGKGRLEIVRMLRNRRQGKPLFRVHGSARWALNAFSGGYSMQYSKAGKGLSDRADDTPYRTMCEALESSLALSSGGLSDDRAINYKYTSDGKKYISSV